MAETMDTNISLQNVLGITWHPTKRALISIDQDGHNGEARGMTVCMAFNLEFERTRPIGALPFQPKRGPEGFASFVGVYHHPFRHRALILYRYQIFIIDCEARELMLDRSPDSLHLAPITCGGWYPDGERFWTFHHGERGPSVWVLWDTPGKNPRIFSLENHAYRFHTAALHPDGHLIGACFQGGPSGFRILSEIQHSLHCCTEPALQRREQTVRYPLFSQDGRYFAMLVNSNRHGHANIGTLCMFDLTTGTAIREISTECSFQEVGVQYMNSGRALAVAVNAENDQGRITIYDAEDGAERYSQLMLPTIRDFAAHPSLPLYALALPTYIDIGHTDQDNSPLYPDPQPSGKAFWARYAGSLRPLNVLPPRVVTPDQPGLSPPLQWEAQTLKIPDPLGIAWNPTAPRLLCVQESQTMPKLSMTVIRRDMLLEEAEEIVSPGFVLTMFDRQGTTWQRATSVVCPAIADFGGFVTAVLHPVRAQALIVQNFGARIVDTQTGLEIARTPCPTSLLGGGWYPNEEWVWLLPTVQEEGIGDWMMWDYRSDQHRMLFLDRDGDSANAVLHPGGELIGATWGGYSCGYHLYRLPEKEGPLGYYRQPTAERSERLAYQPTFSPDGTRLAFVVNPYLMSHANIGVVCIYNVATGDLLTEFSTECDHEKEQGLTFVNEGREIAFAHDSWLCLYDAKTGDERHLEDVRSEIVGFCGHPELPLLASATQEGVTIRSYREPPKRESGTPIAEYDILPPPPAASLYDLPPLPSAGPIAPATTSPPSPAPPLRPSGLTRLAQEFQARFIAENASHFVNVDEEEDGNNEDENDEEPDDSSEDPR